MKYDWSRRASLKALTQSFFRLIKIVNLKYDTLLSYFARYN